MKGRFIARYLIWSSTMITIIPWNSLVELFHRRWSTELCSMRNLPTATIHTESKEYLSAHTIGYFHHGKRYKWRLCNKFGRDTKIYVLFQWLMALHWN